MSLAASTPAPLPDVSRWPRITLVTQVRNAARFLEQTLRSVLSQGYPNLEYIVVDGASTDGTQEIIRKYERELAYWVSEPDRGMYEALNKGFARATGDVLGWLSGTDLLHVRSLFVVGSVFRDLPQVRWITGIPTTFSEEGATTEIARVPRWSRVRFLAGANRHIQQESTFWRRDLWVEAGGRVDDSTWHSGDFELWARFFRHAPLHTVLALIGGFRSHQSSLGLQHLETCHARQEEIVERELAHVWYGEALRAFRRADAAVMRVPKVRYFWWKLVRQGLYRVPGRDFPPLIRFDGERWVLDRG
jgi:glycosyltransferase involved in cell wall biosynthesis